MKNGCLIGSLLISDHQKATTTKIIIINGCQRLPPWTTLKSIKNLVGLIQQYQNIGSPTRICCLFNLGFRPLPKLSLNGRHLSWRHSLMTILVVATQMQQSSLTVPFKYMYVICMDIKFNDGSHLV